MLKKDSHGVARGNNPQGEKWHGNLCVIASVAVTCYVGVSIIRLRSLECAIAGICRWLM